MGFANNVEARCVTARFNSLPQPRQLLLNHGNLGFGVSNVATIIGLFWRKPVAHGQDHKAKRESQCPST